MAVYNIISLDGGGIRGVLTITLIQRILKEYPNLLKNTHLFAGTSIGGIQALALAADIAPEKVSNLFLKDGWFIFYKKLFREPGLFTAKYKNTGLRIELNKLFSYCEAKKLQDIQKKVLVCSFETNNNPEQADKRTNWKPVFFHNYEGTDCDGDENIIDVALATSAAPVYFPQHNTYIDGGVCCNNPSMAAVAQVLDQRALITPKPKLSNIRVLSIGTGGTSQYLKGENHDWGALQWAKPLLNILLEANSDIAHFQCQQILKGNYQRLQPMYPDNTNVALDAADCARALANFAETVDITETVDWLKEQKW